MNPAFFTDGKTITHSALLRMLGGMPLGEFTNSFITLPDSLTRSSSFTLSSARTTVGIVRQRIAMETRTILLPRECCAFIVPLFCWVDPPIVAIVYRTPVGE